MIREVSQEDYKRIYELGGLLHENYKNVYNLNELLTKGYFKILCYEKNNKLIGFLSYTKIDDMVDLLDVVVDPKYRRQKVATNLIDYMITNLDPADKIYLEVSTKNTSAISLYEKFGFEKIHTREKYYGEEDAYVMERVMFGE